jgi:4'-phosphopantetheinyl transferase
MGPDGIDWQNTASAPQLQQGEVQLCLVPLALDPAALQRSRSLLSTDEIARADRYQFDLPRRNFTACRAALRTLLAGHLSLSPRELVFKYGEHGKPALAGNDAVQFNVSHSQDYGLIAIAAGAPLGVDIECTRAMPDMDGMVEVNFSPAEAASYFALRATERLGAFFDGWTRKEAFVKAMGAGLGFPLKDFDVELRPGQPAALLGLRNQLEAISTWSIWGFEPVEGYRAAVALQLPPQSPEYSVKSFVFQGITESPRNL